MCTVAGMTVMPDLAEHLDTVEAADTDAVWVCLLHNDNVNAVEYVVWALHQVFGYARARCEELTLTAHHEGKAVVDIGVFADVVEKATMLGTHQLWATVARDR